MEEKIVKCLYDFIYSTGKTVGKISNEFKRGYNECSKNSTTKPKDDPSTKKSKKVK